MFKPGAGLVATMTGTMTTFSFWLIAVPHLTKNRLRRISA